MQRYETRDALWNPPYLISRCISLCYGVKCLCFSFWKKIGFRKVVLVKEIEFLEYFSLLMLCVCVDVCMCGVYMLVFLLVYVEA